MQKLQEELVLAQSVGDAHQRIADQIKTQAELKRAGVSADSAEGQQIASLVTQIDAATAAMRRQKEAAAEGSVRAGVGSTVSGTLMQMLQGQARFRDLMRNVALDVIRSSSRRA